MAQAPKIWHNMVLGMFGNHIRGLHPIWEVRSVGRPPNINSIHSCSSAEDLGTLHIPCIYWVVCNNAPRCMGCQLYKQTKCRSSQAIQYELFVHVLFKLDVSAVDSHCMGARVG